MHNLADRVYILGIYNQSVLMVTSIFKERLLQCARISEIAYESRFRIQYNISVLAVAFTNVVIARSPSLFIDAV